MILAVAILDVIPDQEKDFEIAFASTSSPNHGDTETRRS
jgi:hypothetical protein